MLKSELLRAIQRKIRILCDDGSAVIQHWAIAPLVFLFLKRREGTSDEKYRRVRMHLLGETFLSS
jgi:hypothetical protein